MVARSGRGVEDVVFNNTPNSANVIPAAALYSYETRLPGEPRREERPRDLRAEVTGANPYRVGDQVYVKPGKARCDTKWRCGGVTKVVSDKVAEIDEVNWHVADVRLAEQRRRNHGEQQCMEMEVECDHGHLAAVVGGKAEDLGQCGGMKNGESAKENDGNDQDVDQEAGIPSGDPHSG